MAVKWELMLSNLSMTPEPFDIEQPVHTGTRAGATARTGRRSTRNGLAFFTLGLMFEVLSSAKEL